MTRSRRAKIRGLFVVATLAVAGAPACASRPAAEPAPDHAPDATGGRGATDASSSLADGPVLADAPPASAMIDGPALRTDVAPGGNFDLSLWQLQEPVGAAGDPTNPMTIGPSMLAGPGGYQDAYFFTDPADGAMRFWDPENGVTTSNSSYPRSELRELNADGSNANWPLSGTNTLSAAVAVTQVPDHVVIGQVHVGTALEAGLASTTKPLLELYYASSGQITLGIEKQPDGGQGVNVVGNVPLGQTFTYVLELTGAGSVSIAIDGVASTFPIPPGFGGYGEYFKAGDYDQSVGTDATVGATVKFYDLRVSHGP